jgi:hypothetical protein
MEALPLLPFERVFRKPLIQKAREFELKAWPTDHPGGRCTAVPNNAWPVDGRKAGQGTKTL